MRPQKPTFLSAGRVFLGRLFRFGVAIPFLTVPLKFWGVIFERDSSRGVYLRRACILLLSIASLPVSMYQILMLGFFPPRLVPWVVDFLNNLLFILDELYFAVWELTGWKGLFYKYFVFLVLSWTVFSPVHAAVAWWAGRRKGRSQLDWA